MNKKFLMLVLFVLLILSALIGIHLYTKKYSDIAVVYEANEQGRFRNTKEISDMCEQISPISPEKSPP